MNELETELQTLQKLIDDLPDSIKKEILKIKISEMIFVIDSYPVDKW